MFICFVAVPSEISLTQPFPSPASLILVVVAKQWCYVYLVRRPLSTFTVDSADRALPVFSRLPAGALYTCSTNKLAHKPTRPDTMLFAQKFSADEQLSEMRRVQSLSLSLALSHESRAAEGKVCLCLICSCCVDPNMSQDDVSTGRQKERSLHQEHAIKQQRRFVYLLVP